MSAPVEGGRWGGPGGLDGSAAEIVVAGGGVAALEGVLALREHLGPGASIELIAPAPRFVYRPLSVAQPFGLGQPRTVDLDAFCRDHGVRYTQEAVSEVWAESRRILTEDGAELTYDALLLAIGARQVDALPGALTFRGSAQAAEFAELLERLRRGAQRSVAFAVPTDVAWALPLYELALMTAEWLAVRGVAGVELTVVTPEPEPLGSFGAAETLRALLEDAAIELRTERVPAEVQPGRLLLEDGEEISADDVVALPRLEVSELPTLPQGHLGYIDVDTSMRVRGTDGVWAAGDATWFPIKQGGLAAQQADIAAASIAASLGARVEVPPFRPVIRAVLLTGERPRYLRGALGSGGGRAEASEGPLWWPPSKIAGRLLAPYLARRWEAAGPRVLEDVEALYGDDPARAAEDQREALELSLTAADADARQGDFGQALKWLEVAEQLNVVLPPDYAEKRRYWEREAALPRRA